LWCEWQGDDSTDGFALCSARAVQCSMDHSTDTFILGIRVLEMAAEGEEADLTGFSLAELGEEAVRVRQLLDDLGLKSAKVQVFTTMYVSV